MRTAAKPIYVRTRWGEHMQTHGPEVRQLLEEQHAPDPDLTSPYETLLDPIPADEPPDRPVRSTGYAMAWGSSEIEKLRRRRAELARQAEIEEARRRFQERQEWRLRLSAEIREAYGIRD